MNLKRSTPRYIIIELSKVKDKKGILKTSRGKRHVTKKGTIHLSADFATET